MWKLSTKFSRCWQRAIPVKKLARFLEPRLLGLVILQMPMALITLVMLLFLPPLLPLLAVSLSLLLLLILLLVLMLAASMPP